ARDHFGDYYENIELEKFIKNNNERFDLIIATELIEHLNNPLDFLENCKKILKDGGKIIITTPNRDYYGQTAIWNTDWPPLHLFWFSFKSFEKMAEKVGLNVTFFNYLQYGLLKWTNNNLLIDYILSRKLDYHNFRITSIPEQARASVFKNLLKFLLVGFSPVRKLFNYVYCIFVNKHVILAVIFEK
ncbi:methyltransferase domain-containing protein, partial [Candidatus Falkowbacteria bacterium]|nr:methyltransferase domain-containing protein [Candidatus Falkowbacteria bacterium]